MLHDPALAETAGKASYWKCSRCPARRMISKATDTGWWIKRDKPDPTMRDTARRWRRAIYCEGIPEVPCA